MTKEELARLEVFKSQICIDRCSENDSCNDCYIDYEDVKAVEHLLKDYNDLKSRIDKAKALCKIVLDNEDKNQDLLDHVAGIYEELQGKEAK